MSDSVNLRTVAHQVPLSMGFSRQEYQSGLPCPSPGDLPDPRDQNHICLLHWQVGSLPLDPWGAQISSDLYIHYWSDSLENTWHFNFLACLWNLNMDANGHNCFFVFFFNKKRKIFWQHVPVLEVQSLNHWISREVFSTITVNVTFWTFGWEKKLSLEILFNSPVTVGSIKLSYKWLLW